MKNNEKKIVDFVKKNEERNTEMKFNQNKCNDFKIIKYSKKKGFRKFKKFYKKLFFKSFNMYNNTLLMIMIFLFIIIILFIA